MQNTVRARKNGSAHRITRQTKSHCSSTATASAVFNPDQILFNHVAATLPDSISGRLQVLKALQCKITHKHPAYLNVCAQISALELFEHLPLSNGGAL